MTAETVGKGDTSVTINGKVIDIGMPVQEALNVGDLLILRTDDYDLPSDDPLGLTDITNSYSCVLRMTLMMSSHC
jgi:hypothetical protein